MTKRNRIGLLVLLSLAVVVLASTQVSLFVVQPIGAVPDGRTLLISRLNDGSFVDSADATCERIQGGVNVQCRAAVLGQVAQNATVYLRMPYSETLYLVSTSGNRYSR